MDLDCVPSNLVVKINHAKTMFRGENVGKINKKKSAKSWFTKLCANLL